jgi:hypothetical protein
MLWNKQVVAHVPLKEKALKKCLNRTPKAVTYTNVNVTGSEYSRVFFKRDFLKWDKVVIICSGSTFGSNRSTCG